MDMIIENLLSLASILLDQSKLNCFVICEEEFMPNLTDLMNSFILQVPRNLAEPCPQDDRDSTDLHHKTGEYIQMSLRVNYNATSFRVPTFLHPDYAV